MTKAARRCFASLLVGICTSLTACAQMTSSPNPRAAAPLTLAKVDLPRYMGEWYIVANIPYLLEKDLVASRTRYTLRADGKVVEHFSAIKGGFGGEQKDYEFIDTPDPATNNAQWSVRLFWPIYVSQTTIYVDDDYQYTLIGYKDKKLGWIFARKPDIDDPTYRDLLKHFEAEGYDTSKFRRVPQRPDQIGRPGFHSPGDAT